MYGQYPAPQKPRTWCGLRPRAALAAAVILLLVVVGGLAGGLAGGLQARNRSSGASPATTASVSPTSSVSSIWSTMTVSADPTSAGAQTTATPESASSTPASMSTSTSTSTSTAFPTPTNNVLPLNCPAINNTQLTTDGQSFFLYCLVDLGSSTDNIAQSLQPSINDCIGSCAEYNSNNSVESAPCDGLTFGADLTRYAKASGVAKLGARSADTILQIRCRRKLLLENRAADASTLLV